MRYRKGEQPLAPSFIRGTGILGEFVEAAVLPARRGKRIKRNWWWNPPKPPSRVPIERQPLFFPEPVVIPWGMS